MSEKTTCSRRPHGRPLHPQRAAGVRGEELACEHLERRGFAIIARNVRTRRGEIDVIAFDGSTLVFAEVKTLRANRTSRRAGPERSARPLDALRFRQRHHIRSLASAWLAAAKPPRAREIRFDAIGVTIDSSGALLALEHIEGAW